jgi:hypothetical protein
MAFWRMIKQGYDHFELTHLEPKVDVCEKRYVIGALSTYSFSPADRCPAYEVPKQVAAAVRDKQRRDDIQTTELITRGTTRRGGHDWRRRRHESDFPATVRPPRLAPSESRDSGASAYCCTITVAQQGPAAKLKQTQA